MPSTAASKTSRLDARITPELREQLHHIAARQGRSVSDYVTSVLRVAVRKDIADMDFIELSRAEAEHFVEALSNPPPLAPAMRRAFAHHRRLVRSE
jgi:uncharacterized protein (DUF1778 family)